MPFVGKFMRSHKHHTQPPLASSLRPSLCTDDPISFSAAYARGDRSSTRSGTDQMATLHHWPIFVLVGVSEVFNVSLRCWHGHAPLGLYQGPYCLSYRRRYDVHQTIQLETPSLSRISACVV